MVDDLHNQVAVLQADLRYLSAQMEELKKGMAHMQATIGALEKSISMGYGGIKVISGVGVVLMILVEALRVIH